MSDQGPVPPADPSGGQPYQQPQYGQPAQPQYGQPAQPQYAPPAGYPQQYAGQPASLQYGAPAPSKTNALALTALIVGVVGLFLCWIPFLGVLIGVVAVVLGFLGIRKAAEVGGKGLAIGGIVAGGLTLLIGLIFTVITLFVVSTVDDNIDDLDRFNEELQQELEQLEEDMQNG
jgi:hypothetical protein